MKRFGLFLLCFRVWKLLMEGALRDMTITYIRTLTFFFFFLCFPASILLVCPVLLGLRFLIDDDVGC